MQTNRISAYRVAVRDSHQNDIKSSKNLLRSQVAEAIRAFRTEFPKNYIFVNKIQVDGEELRTAIIEPGSIRFVEAFEHYEVLSDKRVKVACEYGTWTYGGSYKTREQNLAGAQSAVSRCRYNAYWNTVSEFDISREQD